MSEPEADDAVNIHLANSVQSIDAALSWIVQRIDVYGLGEVCASFNPMWVYDDEGLGDLRYEVQVAGKPKAREP